MCFWDWSGPFGWKGYWWWNELTDEINKGDVWWSGPTRESFENTTFDNRWIRKACFDASQTRNTNAFDTAYTMGLNQYTALSFPFHPATTEFGITPRFFSTQDKMLSAIRLLDEIYKLHTEDADVLLRRDSVIDHRRVISC